MAKLPTAIILAAGASSRMGANKALLSVHGLPLVRAHVEALGSHATAVVVVTGREHEAVVVAAGTHAQTVHNADWATTWPADSLRLALGSFDIDGPCFVTPVDTPPADPATLDALLVRGAPCVPVTATGEPGHPVFIGPSEVDRLRESAPEGGLRTLLRDAPTVVVSQPDIHIDFDTPKHWRTYLESLSARRSG